MADKWGGIAPVMPYSPLDALIDALPSVRKAGRIVKGDDVMSVQQRLADVFLPIVKRIQQETRLEVEDEMRRRVEPLLEFLDVIADHDGEGCAECKIEAQELRVTWKR